MSEKKRIQFIDDERFSISIQRWFWKEREKERERYNTMQEEEEETSPTTPTPGKSMAPPVDAMKLAMELRRAVVPKTHEFNFKSYDRCVLGSDIVDWLTLRTWCENRSHALAVGQYLLEKHYFHHVVYEHGLKDGFYFYRYETTEESRSNEDVGDDGRLEGSLHKLSSRFSAWNRRWFALDGSKLSYWASGHSKYGDAKTSFNLNGAIVSRGLSQAESLTAERRNFVRVDNISLFNRLPYS